jgi:RIO kinase 1
MTFIGDQDTNHAAPRLKDATLSDKRLKETYLELIKMMRIMFVKCRLVHADLSEYV